MPRKIRSNFLITGLLLVLSVLFMVVVKVVDVQPIGPDQSCVGLATINGFILNTIGINMLWYNITSWLGAIAIMVAIGFTFVGFMQLIKRKSIQRVDADILVLGIFYILVFMVYFLFDHFAINYRPVILGTTSEASFPSSHTMIVLCIMSTAILQFHSLIHTRAVRVTVEAISVAVMIATILGRLISGVHWFSDILGGLLVGCTLIMAYFAVTQYIKYKTE